MRWIVTCVSSFLVALAIIAALAHFTERRPALSALSATSTRDRAVQVLSKYAVEPIPTVVLTGSSYTARLEERFFRERNFQNLSLAGGSPLTALEIIESYPTLPRLILVETNILSRGTDGELIKQYHYQPSGQRHSLIRPVRALVSYYELSRLNRQQIDPNTLLQAPPATFDNDAYIERAAIEMESGDFSPAIQDNVRRLSDMVARLEQRGAAVRFYEMPLSPRLMDTKFVKTTRAILHSEFQDPFRWLKLDYKADQLRWPDGQHLDERSSLLIAQAIESALPHAQNVSSKASASGFPLSIESLPTQAATERERY